MKKTTALLCALGVHGLFTPVMATDLGTIVITPTRTEQPGNTSSATVYVVDSATIEASGASTTSDLLRGIPGVQIEDLFGNGSQVNISVRGFSGTANANTLVLVNGRRLNHSDTAGADIHHIFPRDIERIEVLTGSAGALYGDQAVGGVINIITKRPAAAEHRVSAKTGSFNYSALQFSSTMQLNESLGYRFSAETFATDNYRDNSAQENDNFSGTLDYEKDGNRLFLEVQQISDELELPGALIESEYDDDPTQSFSTFADDFINEDTSVTRVGYERDLQGHVFSIDTTFRTTDADLRNSFRFGASPADGFSKRQNTSLNPKIYGSIAAGIEIPYVAGIDLEETDYDLEIPTPGPNLTASSNEQKTQSLFFQVNPRVTEDLQLTYGMRSSSVENDLVVGGSFGQYPDGIEVEDDITVKEIGLAYDLNETTRLTFRRDENFRFAKVDELGQAAFGDILDTQTGESLELGISVSHGNTQIIASLYQLDLKNEIEYDTNSFVNVNLDDTRRTGYSLSLFNQLSTDLGISAQIGRVNAQFTSGAFDGKEVSGVSDLTAKLRTDLRINEQISSYLEYNFSSERYAQGDNLNQYGTIGSITVYNTGASYNHKNWNLSLRINNLFDTQYAEFVGNTFGTAGFQPSPERNYLATVGYRFE